ncbi:MAG TPA: UrcA family protein [Sphingopyxis sp.]|nr:UrcA family protein [Sphingopyxis sp.]
MRDSRHGWALLLCLILAGCAAQQTQPLAVISYRDLDLASPRDQKILRERIDRVVVALCEQEAEERQLGQGFNRFDPGWCVRPTRKSIERALPRAAGRLSDISISAHCPKFTAVQE